MQPPVPLQDYRRMEEDVREPTRYDWSDMAWRAAAIAAGAILLVAIGALIAGAFSAANSDKALDKLHKLLRPDACEGEVSAALGVVTKNIINSVEGGLAFPPDTIMAVGNNDNDGRIIAVVNRAVVILNKATHTRISATQNFYSTGVPGGDPYVTWDPTANRFFLTAFLVTSCRLGLTTYSPPAVAGQRCVANAVFGPQTFNVNGITAVGAPYNGCAAMAPMTGKIAILTRGVCTFAIKVKNAQDAGAIGVIVVNTAESTIAMSGTDPSIVIPTVSVALSVGNALVANSPANVTIASGGITTFSTSIYISVSNTSSPNTRADFVHYTVSDGIYATQYVDYPKHSTTADTFYIASQNFNNGTDGINPCVGPNIRAFNKAALMSGAGAITLWSAIVPGMGITGPRFLFPAETRTPITDQTLPAIFVGTNTGNELGFCDVDTFQTTPVTSLHIHAGTAAGLSSYLGVVPLPTPMTFGVCLPSPANNSCEVTPEARQPLPAIPKTIESKAGVIMTGVVYNGLLYTAMAHNISAVQLVVRWFIIDVAPVALLQQPTLLQWGDLNVDPNIDTFMPHIDVAADGTMGIVFYASGPSQHIVAQYTVRLASDPLNTVRTPFHTAVPNDYVYFRLPQSGRNRYGDYTGLQVDPVNRQTFYGFTQRPDPMGMFTLPGQIGPCPNASLCVAGDWTTDLFTFRADNNTCAADGIVTEPRVLPSTSPVVTPGLAFTGDASSFTNAPEDDEDCFEGEDDTEICFS